MPNMLAGHNSCCGIYLISGFSVAPDYKSEQFVFNPRTSQRERKIVSQEEQFMNHLEQVRNYTSDTTKKCKLVEVVVTDGQMQAYSGWIEIFKREGFVLVSRFNNATGQICNILHMCPIPYTDTPSWWGEPSKESIIAPPPKETPIKRAVGKVVRGTRTGVRRISGTSTTRIRG